MSDWNDAPAGARFRVEGRNGEVSWILGDKSLVYDVTDLKKLANENDKLKRRLFELENELLTRRQAHAQFR